MGYSPHNKEYDLTPRYGHFEAYDTEFELVDMPEPMPERPILPPAPGVKAVWRQAVQAAQEKYPPQEPSYHEIVQVRTRQQRATIPHILVRANSEDSGAAARLAKETNGNNHAQRLITFLGHGVVPTVVRRTAIELAVEAVRPHCDPETAEQLNDAYTFWQQLTGDRSLANMVQTE